MKRRYEEEPPPTFLVTFTIFCYNCEAPHTQNTPGTVSMNASKDMLLSNFACFRDRYSPQRWRGSQALLFPLGTKRHIWVRQFFGRRSSRISKRDILHCCGEIVFYVRNVSSNKGLLGCDAFPSPSTVLTLSSHYVAVNVLRSCDEMQLGKPRT